VLVGDGYGNTAACVRVSYAKWRGRTDGRRGDLRGGCGRRRERVCGRRSIAGVVARWSACAGGNDYGIYWSPRYGRCRRRALKRR